MADERDLPQDWTGHNGVNAHFTRNLAPYSQVYNLSPAQTNAAKHTVTSTIYSDVYGSFASRQLGNGVEVFQDGVGVYRSIKDVLTGTQSANTVDDDLKDIINNRIGREIQKEFPNASAWEYYNAAASLAKNGCLVTDPNFKFSGHPRKGIPTKETEALIANAIDHIKKNALIGIQKCFLAGTMIDMWPVESGLKPAPDGLYDEEEVRAKVWQNQLKKSAQKIGYWHSTRTET